MPVGACDDESVKSTPLLIWTDGLIVLMVTLKTIYGVLCSFKAYIHIGNPTILI